MFATLLRYSWKKGSALKQKIWWLAHKNQFGSLGKNVSITLPTDMVYIKNIYLGNNVIIQRNSTIWCTDARVYFADNSGCGPNTTIITGNHNMSTIGKFFLDVTDKHSGDDEDVIIEEDVYIGANVIILKGVRIGRGAIVGAGSVVAKSVPPYGIAVGNPAKVIKYRFTQEQIAEHERILYNKV